MAAAALNTYQALVSAFCEFLTVAVHTVLAERDVYPRTSFLSARKYNIAVHQSRHPGVCGWINDAVAAVEAQLLKGTVRQTSLVIFSSSSVALERFVFSTADFPVVPAADVLATFTKADGETGECGGDGSDVEPSSQEPPETIVIDLVSQFRGALSRLCTISQKLQPLPKDCTFTIAIELRDKPHGQTPIGWPQPLIPSEPALQKHGGDGTKTTPVRSVDAGAFLMEVWVEESQAKLDAAEDDAKAAGSSRESTPKRPERPYDPLMEAMEGRTYVK